MKKILIAIALLLTTTASAQTITREGNVFTTTTATTTDIRANADSTKYVWTDAKGVSRPIYITRNGACFVVRKSKKTGNTYRQYCPTEIRDAVCRETGVEYKPKNEKK